MFIDIHAHAYRRPTPFVVRFCSPEGLLRDWHDTGKISETVFHKVARENAVRLLGLA